MDDQKRIEELEKKLDEVQELLYTTQSDLKYILTDNIAIKDFIQDLYENCQELRDEHDLKASEVIGNLIENIEAFAKEYRLRL